MNMLVFVSVVCYEYLKDDVPFQRLVTFPSLGFVAVYESNRLVISRRVTVLLLFLNTVRQAIAS